MENRVRIKFYGGLAKITQEKTVEANGSTLREVVDNLTLKYGETFNDKFFDKRGNLRRFINIYVNGKDIRFLNSLDTNLKETDIISMIPAVGGG